MTGLVQIIDISQRENLFEFYSKLKISGGGIGDHSYADKCRY